MEKISRIVRGNSRVAATDLKQAAPVRPGAPDFGRPVGNSTPAPLNRESTAQKAVAIQNEMNLAKKQAAEDRTIQRMADEFFMSKIRRPEPEPVHAEIITAPDVAPIKPADGQPAPIKAASPDEADEAEPPRKQPYTPRGSFVDVRV